MIMTTSGNNSKKYFNLFNNFFHTGKKNLNINPQDAFLRFLFITTEINVVIYIVFSFCFEKVNMMGQGENLKEI